MSIRDHKEEVIRWLKSPDGTKVWAHCTNYRYGWGLIDDPTWDNGCIYIVDDKHAEIRKEWIDNGKQPVQIWDDIAGGWADLHFAPYWRLHERYRIKPTEWETPDGEDPIAYHANRIDPYWEADWSDHKQEKWYVYKAEKYDVAYSWAQKILGTIYMSNSAAEKIADALNCGELIIKDTK